MNARNTLISRKTLTSKLRNALPVRRALAVLALATLAGSAFGQTLTTIHDFGSSPTDGSAPGWGVILDKAGKLYGVTAFGDSQSPNGVVFQLTPPAIAGNPWKETILHRFRSTPDGSTPEGRLTFNSTGALFGTTLRGGSEGEGTVYQMTPPASGQANWQESVIHDFGTVPNDVFSPNLGLFAATEGFYGVDQGGAFSFGAFYLLTPNGDGSWTQTILYNFKGNGDGADPGGQLVRDAAGNFYGVTVQGGANNLGAVYKLAPPAVAGDPWTESVIFSFNGNNGTLPSGKLLLGTGGVLYGTTDGGGKSSAGVVFQLTPPTAPGTPWKETILHSFTGGSDGGFPQNGVITDKKGFLYGNASNVIFALRPPQVTGGAWRETVLHTFTGPDGFIATGDLALTNNTIYGTTGEGGVFGVGTAYKLVLP